MIVHCPKCESEVGDVKPLGLTKPMPCPKCGTRLKFTDDSGSIPQILIVTILIFSALTSAGKISEDTYIYIVIIELVVLFFFILKTKIIAVEE